MKFALYTSLASLGACFDSYDGGPSFEITSPSADKFTITVTGVPENTWFSIGYGEKMSGTDMVWFSATGAGEVLDLIGTTSSGAPAEDTAQSYTDVNI